MIYIKPFLIGVCNYLEIDDVYSLSMVNKKFYQSFKKILHVHRKIWNFHYTPDAHLVPLFGIVTAPIHYSYYAVNFGHFSLFKYLYNRFGVLVESVLVNESIRNSQCKMVDYLVSQKCDVNFNINAPVGMYMHYKIYQNIGNHYETLIKNLLTTVGGHKQLKLLARITKCRPVKIEYDDNFLIKNVITFIDHLIIGDYDLVKILDSDLYIEEFIENYKAIKHRIPNDFQFIYSLLTACVTGKYKICCFIAPKADRRFEKAYIETLLKNGYLQIAKWMINYYDFKIESNLPNFYAECEHVYVMKWLISKDKYFVYKDFLERITELAVIRRDKKMCEFIYYNWGANLISKNIYELDTLIYNFQTEDFIKWLDDIGLFTFQYITFQECRDIEYAKYVIENKNVDIGDTIDCISQLNLLILIMKTFKLNNIQLGKLLVNCHEKNMIRAVRYLYKKHKLILDTEKLSNDSYLYTKKIK